MIINCKYCGLDNPPTAVDCLRCGKSLRPGSPYRKDSHIGSPGPAPETIDPGHQAADRQHRAALATIRYQRRLRRVLSVVAALVVLAGGYYWYRHLTSGNLPTAAQLQSDLKLWPLDPRPGILRGRPLTEIRFTDDASKPLRAPILSLWLDEHDQPVALSASVIYYPELPENKVYVAAARLADDLDDFEPRQDSTHRLLILGSLFNQYTPGLSISSFEPIDPGVSCTSEESYNDDPNQVRASCVWPESRYSFEISTTFLFDRPDPDTRQCLAYEVIFIVKSKDW